MAKFSSVSPIVRPGCQPSIDPAAEDYLLQRLSEEWNTFVDVQDVKKMKDHNRSRVLLKLSCSPQVC